MLKELIQKRGMNYRKHFLYEDRVLVESKTLRSVTRYEVKLDELGSDKTYQADNVTPGKISFAILILLPFLCFAAQLFEHKLQWPTLVFLTVTLWTLALLGYFKQNKDDVFLTGGKKNLAFYRDVPNEKEVLRFIQAILDTKKELLKKRLTRFDDHTQEFEFLARLNYLKNSDIITQEEFDDIYNDYKISRLLL